MSAMLSDIRALHDQLDEARETIRQLKLLIVPPLVLPKRLGLKSTGNRLVVYLMERAPAICTAEQIHEAIYLDRRGDLPDIHNVSVQIVFVRKALAKEGIIIHNHYNIGYSLSAESAAKLRGML